MPGHVGFSSCGTRGCSQVALHRLLIVETSLTVELSSGECRLSVVVHGLSCSMAYGIFLD